MNWIWECVSVRLCAKVCLLRYGWVQLILDKYWFKLSSRMMMMFMFLFNPHFNLPKSFWIHTNISHLVNTVDIVYHSVFSLSFLGSAHTIIIRNSNKRKISTLVHFHPHPGRLCVPGTHWWLNLKVMCKVRIPCQFRTLSLWWPTAQGQIYAWTPNKMTKKGGKLGKSGWQGSAINKRKILSTFT